jgi:DNA-binding beta-propeller fold protein YncE
MIFVTEQRRAAVLALDSLTLGAAHQWLVLDPGKVSRMKQPSGLACDSAERVVVADRGNDWVVVVDASTGKTRVLDSSDSDIGSLHRPMGVALTAGGELIVADTGNRRIVFASSLEKPQWESFGEPGSTGAGEFDAPTGIYVDTAGRVLVADPGAERLVRFNGPDGSGWIEIPLPSGARSAQPYALAGADGGVLVTDLGNARVLLVDQDDTVRVLIDGVADRSLIAPIGVSMLGPAIVVADAGACRMTRWVTDDDGRWTLVNQLDGRPRPGGSLEFSSVAGMTVRDLV